MPLDNSQLSAANELFNRGLSYDGAPLSDKQKSVVAELKSRGMNPAQTLLDDSHAEQAKAAAPVAPQTPQQVPQQGAFTRGVAGTIEGLANTVPNLVNLLARPAFKAAQEVIPPLRNVPFQPLPTVQLTQNGGEAENIGQAIGGLVPAVAGLGAGEAAVSGLPLLERLGGRLATSAGLGAVQTPQDPALGVAGGIGGQLAAEAISPIAGGVLSSLKGLAKGPTALAQKGFLRLMEALPGGLSGVHSILKEKLGSIASVLKGDSSAETVQNDLFDVLKGNFHNAESGSRKAFDDLQESPEFKGLEIKTPETQNAITDQLNLIDPKLKFLEGTGDTQEGQLKDSLNWLQGKANAAKRINNLETAKFFREGINADLRNKTLTDQIPVIKKMGADIKDSLDKELNKSVEESGNTDLIDKWKNANDQYKEFITKWKTEPGSRAGIRKPTTLGNLITQEDPDLAKFFNEHIKPSVSKDATSKINQLFSWLPEQSDKAKVAYDLVKTGEEDPDLFMRTYRRLGNKQKSLLFPEDRAELDDLQKVHARFGSAFKEPKELGRPGKLFETFRVGGAVAGAPLTHGLSLGILAAPGIGKALQGEQIDRSLLKDLLSRIQEEPTGALAKGKTVRRVLRPTLSPLLRELLLGGQKNG